MNPLNYLNIGVGGTFLSPSECRTSPTDVDGLLAYLAGKGTKRLCFYFHGGLVNETTALTGAAAIEPFYTASGVHALFVAWQTGLGETMQRNLGDLAKTELFLKLLKIAFKGAARKLWLDPTSKGGSAGVDDAMVEAELAKEEPFADFAPTPLDTTTKGGGTEPDNDDDVLSQEIQAETEMEMAADPDWDRILADPEQTRYLDPDIRGEVAINATAKGAGLAVAFYAGKAIFNVCKRYYTKRHHDFAPTVVEEILRVGFLADLGATVWNDMKRSAGDMWKPNDGLSGDQQHVGRYLLDLLPAYFESGLEIDLVGHSAGSIAICKMLEAAASAGIALPVRNIIFLAPACTADLFWNGIASHRERFQRFRMFTMQDLYEKQDHLLGRFYPRSLLYLVSGILENAPDCPLAGLERHLIGREPYGSNVLRGVHDFLYEPGTGRLVFSVTSGTPEGLRCSAVHHGGFGEDKLTLESIGVLLR
jgi:hypothetical protein